MQNRNNRRDATEAIIPRNNSNECVFYNFQTKCRRATIETDVPARIELGPIINIVQPI